MTASSEAETIREALGLSASIARSGELWSVRAEQTKDDALAALDALLAEIEALKEALRSVPMPSNHDSAVWWEWWDRCKVLADAGGQRA